MAIAIGSSYFVQDGAERNRDVSLQQLDDTDASARAARVDHWARNQAYAGALACWAALGFVLFASDARRALRGHLTKRIIKHAKPPRSGVRSGTSRPLAVWMRYTLSGEVERFGSAHDNASCNYQCK